MPTQEALGNNVELATASHSFGQFTLELLKGSGEGEPVLFLHGEEGLRNDRAFLEEVAQNHSVTAPFHPGFAGSNRSAAPAGIAELINLYLHLVRSIARAEGRRVVVMGAGFGSWLAAELAIRSPAQVAGLCLVAPVGIRTRPATEREIMDVFNMDLPQLRSMWFAGKADDFLDPENMQETDWLSLARDREGLARYVWIPYMHDPALTSGLGLIEAPTLCLWTSEDRAVRAGYYADFAARIPNSKTEVLNGGGHFPLLSAPKHCLAALNDFLRSTRAAAGNKVPADARA